MHVPQIDANSQTAIRGVNTRKHEVIGRRHQTCGSNTRSCCNARSRAKKKGLQYATLFSCDLLIGAGAPPFSSWRSAGAVRGGVSDTARNTAARALREAGATGGS
jgi:hypothetical protein